MLLKFHTSLSPIFCTINYFNLWQEGEEWKIHTFYAQLDIILVKIVNSIFLLTKLNSILSHFNWLVVWRKKTIMIEIVVQTMRNVALKIIILLLFFGQKIFNIHFHLAAEPFINQYLSIRLVNGSNVLMAESYFLKPCFDQLWCQFLHQIFYKIPLAPYRR